MLAIHAAPAALFAEKLCFSGSHLKKLGAATPPLSLLTSTLIFLPAHSKKIRRRGQMFFVFRSLRSILSVMFLNNGSPLPTTVG